MQNNHPFNFRNLTSHFNVFSFLRSKICPFPSCYPSQLRPEKAVMFSLTLLAAVPFHVPPSEEMMMVTKAFLSELMLLKLKKKNLSMFFK